MVVSLTNRNRGIFRLILKSHSKLWCYHVKLNKVIFLDSVTLHIYITYYSAHRKTIKFFK